MTAMIRHHTEQLHRKATKCAPVFTMRNEPYPEHYEAAYAKAMKALTAKEGHMGRTPVKANVARPKDELPPPPPMPEFDAAILDALTRELTTGEIARKVNAASQRVSARLNGPLAGYVTRRNVRLHGSRSVMWSLSREPHVSCKDRIAAAKAEAHG